MLSNSVSLLDCFASLGLEGVTERINHSDEKAEYFSIIHTKLLCQHYQCPAWLSPYRPIALCFPGEFQGATGNPEQQNLLYNLYWVQILGLRLESYRRKPAHDCCIASARLQQQSFSYGDGCNCSRGKLHNFPGTCTVCAHFPELALPLKAAQPLS